MNFYTRHEPKSFNDLVFEDKIVAQTVYEYTTGSRTKHLLLWGPPGSGKTTAAEIIAKTCLAVSGGSAAGCTFDLPTIESEGFDIVSNSWGIQRLNGANRCYAIINEIDFLKSQTLLAMRTFIDTKKHVTFVCTTNNLHALDAPLQNRFTKLHVALPTASDWLPRAMQIMAAENYPTTKQQLKKLLNAKSYSARDLMSQLEDAILLQQSHTASKTLSIAPPATQSTSTVVATLAPISVTPV
jgi:replication-associated recombination protein RarA